LRGKQVHEVQFYRQKPLGPYIVDFYAPAAGLVVELDGSQHQEPQTLQRDKERDFYLCGKGQALTEADAVLAVIEQSVRQIPLTPLFQRGEKKSPVGWGHDGAFFQKKVSDSKPKKPLE
jgi:very-short-patch-repair endonuclease